MLSKLELFLIKAYRSCSYPVYNILEKAHINLIKCRFEPSCSHYAEDAVKKYGVLKGSFMAVKRISRCNPLHGGYDPVK